MNSYNKGIMITAMDDTKQNEHKLAEKAQRILELQQALQELESGKTDLQKEKPKAGEDKLSYEESIEFGKKVDRYEKKLHQLELQIQKLKRRLSSLEFQAQKLISVAGVRIKVHTYSPQGHIRQSYCIKQVTSDSQSNRESRLEIKQL